MKMIKEDGEYFCSNCGHAIDKDDLSCWYCQATPKTITAEESEVVAQHAKGCAQKWYREYADQHPGEPNIFRHMDTQREFSEQLRKSPYAIAG